MLQDEADVSRWAGWFSWFRKGTQFRNSHIEQLSVRIVQIPALLRTNNIIMPQVCETSTRRKRHLGSSNFYKINSASSLTSHTQSQSHSQGSNKCPLLKQQPQRARMVRDWNSLPPKWVSTRSFSTFAFVLRLPSLKGQIDIHSIPLLLVLVFYFFIFFKCCALWA